MRVGKKGRVTIPKKSGINSDSERIQMWNLWFGTGAWSWCEAEKCIFRMIPATHSD